MAKANKQQQKQPVRDKGGSYPYHLLPAALKLGEAVKNHGGRDVPRAVIASELEMAEAGFNQLVASAKNFGVVEGSRTLSLTDAGRDYFFPTTEGSERQAMLGFFAAPDVFQALIQAFDGARLPNSNLLANVVRRQHGVPDSWAGRVASIFTGTAASLGLVDAGGFLRYGAAKHQAERQGTELPINSVPQATADLRLGAIQLGGAPRPSDSTVQPRPVLPDEGANVWSFTEDSGTVRLESSNPLPRALWERLTKYVEMLEPASINTEGKNEEAGKRNG